MQASMDRLDQLNLLELEVKPVSRVIEDFDSIVLKDVCFKYEQKPVLDHLSLQFDKHKHYHIKGKSGLGKTTLLKLLLGLLKPQSGSLTIQGSVSIDIS